jgi:TonB family protein
MYPNQPQGQFGGPAAYQPQRRGCWGRNWKWIVPVGCLGLILLVLAAAGGIFYFVVSAVKNSDVYNLALEKVKEDQAVVAELGQPISDGWLLNGSIETHNGDSHAKFQFPVSGPKNSATVYVDALKVRDLYPDGRWHFQTLEVEVKGQPGRINILQGTEGTEGTGGDASIPPPLPPSTPSASSSNRMPISGGVLNDKAISKPQPLYPPIAKAAKASGTVTVQVTVDESGNVISAAAVSGHPLLQQAAVAAARQARFAPYKLNGSPVKVTGVLTYNFVPE